MCEVVKERVLIFVPHPDDELNVAGQVMSKYHSCLEFHVVYLTNGDFFAKDGEKRVQEAISSCVELGIDKQNIHFLGYGNEYRDNKNLYNAKDNEVLISMAGKTQTYSVGKYEDVSYRFTKKHNQYTRNNCISDIKKIIKFINPTYIFSTDLDFHPDHMDATLLLQESVRNYVNNSKKHPLMFFKFAYDCAWLSENDYYAKGDRTTQKPRQKALLGMEYDLDVPAYCWEKRVRLAVDEDTICSDMKKNIMYKAAKKHKTQNAQTHITRICNSDSVYFLKRTDNLMFQGNVSAESGIISYINDFKYVDSSNLLSGKKGTDFYDKGIWIPENNKSFIAEFDEKIDVSEIVVSENFAMGEDIQNMKIEFSNGFVFYTKELNHTGQRNVFEIEKQYGIDGIICTIVEWRGCYPGLTQFELYDKTEADILCNVPFEFYSGNSDRINSWGKIPFILCYNKILEVLQRIKEIIKKTKKCGVGYYIKKIHSKLEGSRKNK